MSNQRDVEKITAYRKLIRMGVSTNRQNIVLLAIKCQPMMRTSELAKVIGSQRANAGVLAQQLKEKGLIDWTYENGGRGHDKRIYHLTERGKEAIEEARKS